MTTPHGCAGRTGRSRRLAALAASGIALLAPATRPALACHIPPHKATTESHNTSAPASSAAAVSVQSPAQALANFMKVWNQDAKPTAQPQVVAPVVTPTSMATTMAPAAQMLAPAAPMPAVLPTHATAPTVQNWHQTAAPASVVPPVPPSTCSPTSPTAASQGLTPPTPLKPPAALLNPPGTATPAPEPSTILTGLALVGAAFAYRRRA